MAYILIKRRLGLLEIGQSLKQLMRCVVHMDWLSSIGDSFKNFSNIIAPIIEYIKNEKFD